jgi:hypothetical protein
MASQNRAVVVNGESPESATLRVSPMSPGSTMMCPTKHIANTWQRLLTYPVVQEGIRRFQDHRFGQLAIQVTSTIYKIGSPVLSVLQGPYNRLLAGYIEKVDSFGEQTLSKAEERFPVMKKSTPEIIEEAKQAANIVVVPVKHVTEVYESAYKETGGQPLKTVARGRAALKTAAVITEESVHLGFETFSKVKEFLASRAEAATASAPQGEAGAKSSS